MSDNPAIDMERIIICQGGPRRSLLDPSSTAHPSLSCVLRTLLIALAHHATYRTHSPIVTFDRSPNGTAHPYQSIPSSTTTQQPRLNASSYIAPSLISPRVTLISICASRHVDTEPHKSLATIALHLTLVALKHFKCALSTHTAYPCYGPTAVIVK